jgi:hypothetical protein
VVSARTLARGARRVLTVVLVVAGARSLLGVILSSVVLSLAGLWLLWRAWCRLEQHLDARERALVAGVLVPQRVPRPAPAERHVAFARALSTVAAAYEFECEQETSAR